MRIALVLLLALSACGKGDAPPPPSSGAPGAKPETGPGTTTPVGENGRTPQQEAQVLFANVCATCHGADGTGNGVASESLPVKPRNYTDAEWQKATTDDEIKKIILEGGKAVGKSELMPPQTQLKDKPAVLDELVKIIRGFGK